MIYLDYAANTPVDKRVLEKYNEITLKYFGNPNSLHKLGIEAKKEIDNSSEIIANYFNTKKENIIYTSGSSESNNLVIKGIADRYQNKGKHIIISEIEHSSVIAPCNYLSSKGFDITVISLDKNGNIDLEQLKKSLREDTILVSIAVVDFPPCIKGVIFISLKLINTPEPLIPKNLWGAKVKKSTYL